MSVVTLCAMLVFCMISAPLATARNDVKHADWVYDANETIRHFEEKKPELRAFFEKAHGYAVFPSVSKVAYVFGLATGKGTVFENGEVTGFSRLTQATFGFQAGLHNFREVVFFRNKEVFDKFKKGGFEIDVQVAAVAGSLGISAGHDFDKDVLVYVMTKGGLLFDASLGSQKFSFEPK